MDGGCTGPRHGAFMMAINCVRNKDIGIWMMLVVEVVEFVADGEGEDEGRFAREGAHGGRSAILV